MRGEVGTGGWQTASMDVPGIYLKELSIIPTNPHEKDRYPK
jgi:hypothetical protein